MLASLAIESDLGSAVVTLDGQSKGDLTSQRLDLSDLKPGSHQIVVSDNGKTLELSVQVSDQGSVSIEGAKGLDENAVIGISQARGGQAIFCRCKGAELEIDGKKLQSSGHDRYKLPAQEQPEYALTLVRGRQQPAHSIGGRRRETCNGHHPKLGRAWRHHFPRRDSHGTALRTRRICLASGSS